MPAQGSLLIHGGIEAILAIAMVDVVDAGPMGYPARKRGDLV